MKWAMAQLRKLRKPFDFEYDIDLKAELESLELDILEYKSCHITGTCEEISYDEYRFNIHISCLLVMQCAVTLEPVDVPLEFDAEEIYSRNCDDDSLDIYPIEKEQINLDEAVVTDIICEIPMKVVKPGCEDMYPEEDEPEEYINPAFKALL